ncbi:hypothetical protein Vafri_16551, partial [Volvox africanus]
YTCSRPELDVRQDEAGFVFGIFICRSVLSPIFMQLRPVAQLVVSVGMAAVDLVHVHVLWGGGAVRPELLVAAVAAVALANLAVSAALDAQQRREFAAKMRDKVGGDDHISSSRSPISGKLAALAGDNGPALGDNAEARHTGEEPLGADGEGLLADSGARRKTERVAASV